jgi:hypothetical protein
MNFLKPLLAILIMLPTFSFAQSDFEKAVKAGEVLVTGFSIFKSSGVAKKSDSKIISSVCIKNRMLEKITFIMTGKDAEGVSVIKEMVIQNDGKECVFNILKGIYTYEILLANKEQFKKGEYNFDDDVVIVVKKDN